MWLATKFGYYSIVQTKNRKDLYMVRARVKTDLENLKNGLAFLKKRKIKETYEADYHFRIFVEKAELDIILIYLSNELDYSNFKDKVKVTKGQEEKLPFYSKIWGIMYNFQWSKEKSGFYYEQNFQDNRKDQRLRKRYHT